MSKKKPPKNTKPTQLPTVAASKVVVRRWFGDGQSVTRMASLLVLIVILVVMSLLFYRVMVDFILPLFLAALFTVIFRPIHRWMLCRFPERDTLCAGLTTAAILCFLLLPSLGILGLAAKEGYKSFRTFDREKLRDKLGELGTKFRLTRPFAVPINSLDTLILELPDKLPATQGALSKRTLDTLYQINVQVANLKADLSTKFDLIQATGDFSNRDDDDENRRAAKRMIRMKALSLSADEGNQLEQNDTPRTESVIEFKPLDKMFEALSDIPDPEVESEAILDEKQLAQLDEEFPKLKAYYLDAREKLHGGAVRMIATDVFFPTDRQFADAENYVEGIAQKWLPSLTGQVSAIAAQSAIGIAIMVLGMFYFLKDGPGMIRAMMRLSPLDDRYEQELLGRFDSVSRAVVLATLLSAIVQGLLAGIGYYFAGLQSVFLLTMLTMVMAMIPVVGAGAIWIPTCLWLAVVDNRVMAAVVLAVYGAGVVSMVDNFIKPAVLHGQSNLHPLLALLSVLGGVKALGPIGIIVGPMSVSFLQALLNMLHMELQEMGQGVVTEHPQAEALTLAAQPRLGEADATI